MNIKVLFGDGWHEVLESSYVRDGWAVVNVFPGSERHCVVSVVHGVRVDGPIVGHEEAIRLCRMLAAAAPNPHPDITESQMAALGRGDPTAIAVRATVGEWEDSL